MIKKVFIYIFCFILAVSLVGCGESKENHSGTESAVSADDEWIKKLESQFDEVIEVSEEVILNRAVAIVGNKEITGDGRIIVSVEDAATGYAIRLLEGAQVSVGGSVEIVLSGTEGIIHIDKGAELTLQGDATVTREAAEAVNLLIEGSFVMNGGSISRGHHNIVCKPGASFTWNQGEVKMAMGDAVVIEEDASIHIASKEAKLTEVYARGLVINGNAIIDGVVMRDSMDSMIVVGPNGNLIFHDGKISEAGVHGIDNAGTLCVTGGIIYDNYHSGICNTGTLEITGGDILSNADKGVLNKAGTAVIVGKDVSITQNHVGVANEIGAYLELTAASVVRNSDCEIYAYDGKLYIHDIILDISDAGCIKGDRAEVILENVQAE